MPQTFELVGRDSNGTPVVRYGFTLKQWFVIRGSVMSAYSNALSWCSRIGGYRLPKVKDLTNSNRNSLGATPSSPGNHFMRHIGSGFFSEWSYMRDYSAGFYYGWYWTSDPYDSNQFFVITDQGFMNDTESYNPSYVLCVYP
ncbi:hypothetical protein [Gilliamella sp. B3372]|uniref:hypothetical protein n=1 Tax=Gilliamella sp. B3372 TaxID=2817990 RepID=UPI002269D09C|nr:hypothetical protein [Gilliamella sp. B3372]MCX8583020.1 hypothetical protein [Gilliamella sp. B3372]